MQSATTPGAEDCGHLLEEHDIARGELVRQVLERVGSKWSLLVVANLNDGPRRYTDLLQVVAGISQRMLTLTLGQLVEDGLITRTAHAEMPPRVEYALAPLGKSLLDTATALVQWASDHHDEIRAHQERNSDRKA